MCRQAGQQHGQDNGYVRESKQDRDIHIPKLGMIISPECCGNGGTGHRHPVGFQLFGRSAAYLVEKEMVSDIAGRGCRIPTRETRKVLVIAPAGMTACGALCPAARERVG